MFYSSDSDRELKLSLLRRLDVTDLLKNLFSKPTCEDMNLSSLSLSDSKSTSSSEHNSFIIWLKFLSFFDFCRLLFSSSF